MTFIAASPHAVAQPTAAPAPAPENQQLSPEESKLREDWRISMAQVPLPKKGCFEATYPNKEWREVQCTSAPPYPMPPRRGPRPLIVGNDNDVSAKAPTGFISSATGSFDTVTGVTSESGPIGNSGPSGSPTPIRSSSTRTNSRAAAARLSESRQMPGLAAVRIRKRWFWVAHTFSTG